MKTLAVALAALALGVAGCGSNNNSSSDTSAAGASTGAPPPTTTQSSGGGGGGGEQLSLSADPSGALKFDKGSLSAKAGKVTVTLTNPSSLPHAIAVEGNGVDQDGSTVMKGGKSTVTVNLKPGKYNYYCPVDGHRAAGMEGTLTVK
jgi:plastocyanin